MSTQLTATEAEIDKYSDDERLAMFCKLLIRPQKEEDDLFERQLARPGVAFSFDELADEEAKLDAKDSNEAVDGEINAVDAAIIKHLQRPRPNPLLRLEKVFHESQQLLSETLASYCEPEDINLTLGAAQFYVDVVDKIVEQAPVSDSISVVVECYHYDSIDPFQKPQIFTREESEKIMYVRYMKTFAVANRSVLEKLPALRAFVSQNSPLRAIKLAVPRYETLSAMIMALTFTAETKNSTVEDENVFELYAISQILGIDELTVQCRQRICHLLTTTSVVLAGYLAARYGDLRLLEHVHQWIVINLIETGKLAYLETTPDPSGLSLEAKTLVFRRFRLQHGVFRDIIKNNMQRFSNYITFQKSREALKLVRERAATDNGEATYVFLDPETNHVKLAARYDALRGEYIISRTRDIGLHNQDYVGGITFNIPGTCFTIFEGGSRCTAAGALSLRGFDEPRTELGAVLYVRNFFGWEPREFSIALPREQKNIAQRQYQLGDYYSYDPKEFILIRNKPPKWNEERATYTLDFRNHVKKASKKNFILETYENAEPREVMMMGKLERDMFYVHYNEPLSLLSTFGVCLSSFHKKRLVK